METDQIEEQNQQEEQPEGEGEASDNESKYHNNKIYRLAYIWFCC